MDIQPVNPGHVLVIPVSHVACLAELDPDSGADLFRVGQRVAAAIRRSDLRCEGVNLLLADGEAAGQEVFHVHLHVIPRYRGDGSGFRFGGRTVSAPARSELDRIAEKLRGSLG
jgi:histidine triad (HIT) family protein